MRILVAGGAGFIGSHISRRLKSEGHHVVVADIEVFLLKRVFELFFSRSVSCRTLSHGNVFCDQENPYWKVGDYCDEFHLLDLRYLDNCLKVTHDLDNNLFFL